MAKPKLALIPAAQGDKFYSVLPSDGVGDFDFTRNSSATRIAPTGFIQEVGAFGSELASQPVNLVNDFSNNSGGVIVDADTFTTAGGTLDGIITKSNIIPLTVGKTYTIQIEGNTTSSGFSLGSANGSGNEYGYGFGTFNFTTTSTGNLRFYGGSFSGSIDNVSVIEIIGNKSRLNYDLLNGKVVNCPHYLLEPASTNLITYSEDFSDSSWTKTNLTVSSNQIISPNGSLNADLLIPNTNNIVHTVFAQTVVGNQSYTVFLKAGGYNYAFLGQNNASDTDGAFFDLINGIVAKNTSTLSASIKDYGNGWFRCSLIGSFSTSFRNVCVSENGQSFVFAGDGVKGIYSWGAQIEALTYPTSYIPTNGTAITRAAESATGSGDAATFNDSEGVLMVEFSSNNSAVGWIGLGSNSSNRLLLGVSGGNVRSYNNIGGTVINYQSTINSSSNNKISIKYKSGDTDIYINGFKLFESNSAFSVSSPFDEIQFKNLVGETQNFYGNTREVQYFDSALTDAQLETLTSWTSLQEMITSQLYTNY